MNKVLYLTGTNNSARIRLMRSSSDVSLSSSDLSSIISMGLLRLDRPVYKKRILSFALQIKLGVLPWKKIYMYVVEKGSNYSVSCVSL